MIFLEKKNVSLLTILVIFTYFLNRVGVPNVYICFEKKHQQKTSIQQCSCQFRPSLNVYSFREFVLCQPSIAQNHIVARSKWCSVKFNVGTHQRVHCLFCFDWFEDEMSIRASIRRCLIQISHTLTFKNKINSHHSKFFCWICSFFRFKTSLIVFFLFCLMMQQLTTWLNSRSTHFQFVFVWQGGSRRNKQ